MERSRARVHLPSSSALLDVVLGHSPRKAWRQRALLIPDLGTRWRWVITASLGFITPGERAHGSLWLWATEPSSILCTEYKGEIVNSMDPSRSVVAQLVKELFLLFCSISCSQVLDTQPWKKSSSCLDVIRNGKKLRERPISGTCLCRWC